MGFFRGAIGAVLTAARASFVSAERAAAAAVRATLSVAAPPTVLIQPKQTGLPESVAKARTIAVFTAQGKLPDAIVRSIAEASIPELQKAVDPISRTGRLKSSFSVQKRGPAHYETVSSVSYALSLTDASAQRTTDVNTLVEWMRSKPEFGGLSDRERRRVGFAISRSIRTGAGLGRTGRSDLAKLSPVGARAYDYPGVALNQLRPQIESIGVRVREVIG